MSKIAITADVHFGVPGRLQDILWAARTIREYCKAAKIDTVLILGDLFHDRLNLGIDVLSRVCKFFEETHDDYNQQWVAFPGNHDMFLRHSWSINSLVPMRRYMTVVQDIKLMTIDDTRFWALPFIQNEKSYMKILDAINRKAEEGDNLLTHIGVRGATLNTCFLLKDWGYVTFEHVNFNRIYTGHFHSKQQIGQNVWYPGAPIPFKFDEGDIPHGFYVYDLEEDEHKFINIWKAGKKLLPGEDMPPQFCTFYDELLEEKTQEDVEGNLIRIATNRDYSSNEKKEIKEKLINMGARAVRWMNLNKNKKDEDEEIPRNITLHADNLFNTLIEEDDKGTKDLDKKILIECNSEIVTEGEERYTAEELGV